MKRYLLVSLMLLSSVFLGPVASAQIQNDGGSIGIEGTIPSPPPTTGATISSPNSGSVFSSNPISVTGICPSGLLVKLFKSGVFAGSAVCQNGTYSITTDLFSGQNDLVAIVFDDLDQEGPPSNTVTVTYNDNTNTGPLERVNLTSSFARRGANPGQTLNWPILISGGSGPYAVSVNWGDGEDDLTTVASTGEFNISHEYQRTGIYTIIVKATDSQGRTAYLQLVGIANGDLEASLAETNNEPVRTITNTRIIWQPTILLIPFIISTFWLGKRYELKRIRKKIEAGELPFKLR